MEAITLPIYNTQGQEVDSVKLDSAVFDGVVNTKCLYQVIHSYLANQRKGLAATKTRGEVSGGGRKPWKQKGTGRARVGSIRSPLWRHGGVVFGPHPRDFSYEVPQKIKNLALKSSLNAKVKENNLIILDNLKLDKPKTKDAAQILANLKLRATETNKTSVKEVKDAKTKPEKKPDKILLLLSAIGENEKLALGNIRSLETNLAKQAHAYEVFSHKKLVITKDGLKDIVARLKK